MGNETRLIIPEWLAEEKEISCYLRGYIQNETDEAVLFGKKPKLGFEISRGGAVLINQRLNEVRLLNQ